LLPDLPIVESPVQGDFDALRPDFRPTSMAPCVSGGNTQVLFTALLVDKRHKAA
jgi:hypothetical protein